MTAAWWKATRGEWYVIVQIALLAAFGWALLRHGWLILGYVLAGGAFIEVKVRREERWLPERFPGYEVCQRRVRKLIPSAY